MKRRKIKAMNANIYRQKKRIFSAYEITLPLLARNLLLIKAFIEKIYNHFIVYLFLLIVCEVVHCHAQCFEEHNKPIVFSSYFLLLLHRATLSNKFMSDVFAIFIYKEIFPNSRVKKRHLCEIKEMRLSWKLFS